MESYKEQILRDTKTLLNTDEASDGILILLIDDCISAVLTYCRIEVLPYQLLGLITQMTVKRYKAEYLSGKAGAVTSVTEGDRKIDFSVPDTINVTEDYTERLKPFVNIKGRIPSDLEADA